MVCIDVKGSGCESFEEGREAMIDFVFWNHIIESCRFQLLIVDCTAGNILFFIARLSKVYRINQSIGLSIYLRKLVFNNYDYDEQALLNKLAGTIFQK